MTGIKKFSSNKYMGTIVVDGVEIGQTLQCVHCGRHWELKPGSGAKRGYCMNCNGPYCGPSCDQCVPYEKMIERIERAQTVHIC